MLLDNQLCDKLFLDQLCSKLDSGVKLVNHKINDQQFKVISNQVSNELVNFFSSSVSGQSDLNSDLVGLNSRSDLTPGVYEGGFKVWECSRDMIEFIKEEIKLTNEKTALDLGCGGGLVGINLLKLSTLSVDFQDFNPNVLKYFTLPNILINLKTDDQSFMQTLQRFDSRTNFVSGDWSNFSLNKKYDLIFSCETVYNQENYPKLLKILTNCLSPDGSAYFGTKSYYFGVGGGSQEFTDFVNKSTDLECEEVKVISDCIERSILKINHKK